METIRFTQWCYNQLCIQKQAYAPRECCALILGRKAVDGTYLVENICPIENISVSQEHEFIMNPQQQVNIIRGCKTGGGYPLVEVIAYYHSHPPNSLGVPSAKDTAEALKSWAIGIHLIHGIDGLNAYWWDDEKFTQMEVDIV